MNKEKLVDLANRLNNQSEIDVLAYVTNPGLTTEEITCLSEAADLILPEALTSFYRITNGLSVVWMYKDNQNFDQLLQTFNQKIEKGDNWVLQSGYYGFDGVIQLLPLKECLLNDGKDHWWFTDDDCVEFTWQGFQLDSINAAKKIRLFDVYGKYNTIGLFWHDQKVRVVFGEDHEATFFDHSPMEINEYLDFIFASAGAIVDRKKLLETYQL